MRLNFAICLILACPLAAAELSQTIDQLLTISPRTTASDAEVKANFHRKRERDSRNRAPNLSVDTNYGPQISESFGQPAVREADSRGYNVRFTQLLMDFGRAKEALRESEHIEQQSVNALAAARQGMLLEALTAILSVQRSQIVLDSARKAELNIKEQARLEDALVQAGKGYRSDVLHAKSQLAAAEARRVRAEGALEVAIARVGAVFGVLSEQVNYNTAVDYPKAALPESLAAAIETASDKNLQLRIGLSRSTALKHRIEAVKLEEHAPKIEAVSQLERNWNADGVLRRKRDDRFMVKISWDTNLGAAETHRIESVRQELKASEMREAETRQLVEEQVRIAWRNLETAKVNSKTIANQVTLAKLFLDAAKQERTSGRRSLLDVLSAETRVTEAEADLAATDFDLKIAAFTLMQAVGLLDESTVLYKQN